MDTACSKNLNLVFMKSFDKLVVLENDIEHQGLPDSMQDILDENKHTEHQIWWWFGEDVRQNPEKSMMQFNALAANSLFITQPSFVGYGNSFEGKLFLFKKLMEVGIKISIGIAYYPNFYWFLINWLGDIQSRPKVDRQRLFEDLKACVNYHDIYYADSVELKTTDKRLLDCFLKLTWDDLMVNYFEKGMEVRIKATGEVVKLEFVYFSDKPERFTFCYDDGIDRKEKRVPIPQLGLSEIEKI